MTVTKVKKRCGTCRLWAGNRKSNTAARCNFVAEQPVLPTSITEAYGFHWPPNKSIMERSDGTRCPTWVERQPEEGCD